jgi:hypothetical protein
MMTAIEIALGSAISVPNVTDCKARCANLQGARKRECENECEALEAIAAVAARLRRDLLLSFRDVIWNGGNIDPLPDPFAFERAVRDRFAETPTPPRTRRARPDD